MGSLNAMIKQAKSWVGCRESDGTFRKILDAYNSIRPLPRGYKMQDDDSWCAAFVSACAQVSGNITIFPAECSVQRMKEKSRDMGIYHDGMDCRQGDILFYDWDGNGWADHTGIVVETSGSWIKVIEGNKSDAVGYRQVTIGVDYVEGFARPNYMMDASVQSIDEVAQAVIRGDYGDGVERKKNLESTGYNYNTVQTLVNAILAGQTVAKTYYTIRHGDTLSDIAEDYGSTVTDICKWNSIDDPNKIYVGDKIRVK